MRHVPHIGEEVQRYMARQAREFMQTDVIVLSILLYALLGKGADTLVKALERWRLAWHPAFQAQR